VLSPWRKFGRSGPIQSLRGCHSTRNEWPRHLLVASHSACVWQAESDLRSVECPEPVEGQWFLYDLLCERGLLYVGIALDVGSRITQHKAGKGARQTSVNRPLRLVFVEGPMEQTLAAKRERQIKKWSRAKKEALIKGDLRRLKSLAKSRD